MALFSRKKKDNTEMDEIQALKIDNEKEVQKIKDATAKETQEATSSLKTLNDLVEAHGASGVLFAAMGGNIKK